MIGACCYVLSIPLSIAVHPILGIVVFLMGNFAMFWNMKLNSWGGNHYHTHYHNSTNQNLIEQMSRPYSVTQAVEHSAKNEMGQVVSIRKLTKWDN